ncbi:MFS transporter [Lentzea sp. NBRC 105346]|uniref:MFS transporter n=1 Tax=Lentzea sp. NBRC 105346 TaxID=3032205 RepID=UPI0024A383F8|nr:MFS transporter [Lentzea sp. NBRC 105346]GLZ28202.1 MFS transporter [Lentzea sp. NBRC 105346]
MLWAAEAQSTAGDQLARVAVLLLVYERTGSAAWSGLMLALTYLPDLLGTLGMSWLADRHRRRTVMIASAGVQAAAFAAMAVPGAPMWMLAVLISLATIALAPYRAAAQALLYELVVEDDERLAAQSVFHTTRMIGQVAGLGAGGGIVALIGANTALLINALTFGVAAVLLACGVRRGSRPPSSASTAVWFTRNAITTLAADPRLLSALGLMCLAAVTAVPEAVAALLADQLRVGSAGVGALLAAHPVGMAVGIAFAVPRGSAAASRRAAWLVWTSLLPLAGFAMLFLQPSYWIALSLLTVSGIGLAYHPVLQTEFSSAAPPELLGSITGLARMALRLSQGCGLLLGGVAAQATGSAAAAVAGAAVIGCGLAACGLRIRRRAVSSMESDTPATT